MTKYKYTRRQVANEIRLHIDKSRKEIISDLLATKPKEKKEDLLTKLYFPDLDKRLEKLTIRTEPKECGLVEKCPNCLEGDEGDPSVEPMPDGSCGVCGGAGKITWKPIGKIVDKAKEQGECKVCHGTGVIQDDGYDGDAYSRGTFCDTCNGTGEVTLPTKECTTCKSLKTSSPTPDGDEICPNCGGDCMDYEPELPTPPKPEAKRVEKIERLKDEDGFVMGLSPLDDTYKIADKVNELVEAVNDLQRSK